MKVTRHREKILEVLREWFRVHKEGPTLEELCRELGKNPRQKATVQKWLQTMRNVDVIWDDHMPRSLRLLTSTSEPEQPPIQLSETETLRYLATGVVEWEKLSPHKRSRLPEALRIGMSRMYLTSLCQGEKAPENLPQFLEWAESPASSWTPTQAIPYLSSEVTLIEDGSASDFAKQWQVSGNDAIAQVQQSVMKDVLEYCRGLQLEEAYRKLRKLIITKPTLPYSEYRPLLSDPQLKPLREFLPRIYENYLIDLAEDSVYYLCPRCHYLQRQRSDSTYACQSSWCESLSAKLKLPPLLPISKEEAKDWKAVTHGAYQFVTLPGICEINLAEQLSKLGAGVTLWPKIDEFDLLVELPRKISWAIDLKDWSSIDRDRLQKVDCQRETTETFVVFPDEREESLRIKVQRQHLEPELKGVRLRLFSEIIELAKEILDQKKRAKS